ncbi:MAG: ribonuclease P protein component [Gemmatimonadetes bacterium]|nr:ribonuclease P protein component [Gemmatimonadota bacterium]
MRRAKEIRELLRRGKRRETPHLDVFLRASPAAHPRVGLVVPRYGRRVVERNRLRRRLREAARLELLPRLRAAGGSTDVLLRARRAAYGAEFRELRAEIADLAGELCSEGSSAD